MLPTRTSDPEVLPCDVCRVMAISLPEFMDFTLLGVGPFDGKQNV